MVYLILVAPKTSRNFFPTRAAEPPQPTLSQGTTTRSRISPKSRVSLLPDWEPGPSVRIRHGISVGLPNGARKRSAGAGMPRVDVLGIPRSLQPPRRASRSCRVRKREKPACGQEPPKRPNITPTQAESSPFRNSGPCCKSSKPTMLGMGHAIPGVFFFPAVCHQSQTS